LAELVSATFRIGRGPQWARGRSRKNKP